MTYQLPNRTFGVELEVMFSEPIAPSAITRKLRSAGIDAAVHRYCHTASDSHWYVKPDASLGSHGTRGAQRGWEIVSPVLRGEAGIDAMRKVAAVINTLNPVRDARTCGVHVHVGTADFQSAHLAKLGKLFVWFEGFFDCIMPRSRRGSSNHYVASNRHQIGGAYDWTAINTTFDRIEAANAGQYRSLAAVSRAINPQGRYAKLNTTRATESLPTNARTVEFRQHSYTTDADKIEHWIRLCMAMVEKAKTTRVRRRSSTASITAADEYRLMISMLNLPLETKCFLNARKAHFDQAERRGRFAPRPVAQRTPEYAIAAE